jgi:hypothetical protein
VTLYSSLSLLRQKLQPGNQIHGVILQTGKCQVASGRAFSKCHYYLRTPTVPEMDQLKTAFEAAVNEAATVSGIKREQARPFPIEIEF